jgi:phosphoribosylamine---glycine ligase
MTVDAVPVVQTQRFPVLVVGSGAREHALVWALAQSPSVSQVWAAPGNPGMVALATLVDLAATDVEAIASWAETHQMGLVVIGPDAAVAAGLADELQKRDIPAFGPSKAAAELEWSKSFAKDFMLRHGIPTAGYAICDDAEQALAQVRNASLPIVVKADGLAAGKGVIICQTREEAEAAVRAIMRERAFGAAGDRLVIEEYLVGEELSVFALIDGERYALLPMARDYKRLRDGDEGPNTGGMGSFAPVTGIEESVLEQVRRQVLEPTIAGLIAEGRPYRGVLYVGFMLTTDGPKVLEFNCRFGDPETQVILPLLDVDLAALLLSCAQGRLEEYEVRTRQGFAVSVVLAAAGYPERPQSGDAITGIGAAQDAGALIFHAGTANRDGELVTNGGRVLSVVATRSDVVEATELAYGAADLITFHGKQLRRDIACGAAVNREAQPLSNEFPHPQPLSQCAGRGER